VNVLRTSGVSLVLLAGFAVSILSAQTPSGHRHAAGTPRFKAVAFDYFVLFNPDSVVPVAER
jgi:hypothetical protein